MGNEQHAEEFLLGLCEKTFLALWGYRHPSREEITKTLCDFLVVCDPDIIILTLTNLRGEQSDALRGQDLTKAIESTAARVYEAELALRDATEVTRSDGTKGISLPSLSTRRVHRAAVIITDETVLPVPSMDLGRGFVHILDDGFMAKALTILDTVTDFLDYLKARDRLLSAYPGVVVSESEKNLLARYLAYKSSGLIHGFPVGEPPPVIGEGEWDEMIKSERFRRRLAANRASYAWDKYVDFLSRQILSGQLELDGDISANEAALRAMVLENRFSRRLLADAFEEFRHLAFKRRVKARMLHSRSGVGYVFFAPPSSYSEGERLAELQARCYIARGSIPDAERIVGLGINLQPASARFSTDLILFSPGEWTAEDQEESERLKAESGFFKTPTQTARNDYEYPAERDISELPGGPETGRDGPIQWWQSGEDSDPEVFRQSVIDQGEAANSLLLGFAEKFIAACRDVDPAQLIAQIQFFNFIGPDRSADAMHLGTREALVEHLANLALTLESPATDFPDQNRAYDLFQDLPEVRQALLHSYLGRKFQEEASREALDEARMLLGMENIIDRMEGYTQHLTRMYSAVFDPLRETCRRQLGFTPSDIPAVVTAIVEEAQAIMDSAIRESVEGWGDPELRDLKTSLAKGQQQLLTSQFLLFSFCSRSTYLDTDAIATAARVPRQEVESLLDAMSASWGVTKDYRSLLAGSPFRQRPVLKTARGYSAPLPWMPLHEGFRWFDALLLATNRTRLRQRYLRQRDQATEDLALEALSGVFGQNRVYGPVEYQIGDDWIECDGIVVVEPHVLIVEAKAHAMTAPGRRGAPGRVKTKVKELVNKPIDQGVRLARELLGSGCTLRDQATKTEIRIGEVTATAVMAVSFRRIDPLHHLAGRFVGNEATSVPIWGICLADLLMVTDLLGTPASFLAYSWTRSQIISDDSLLAITEADLLAGFLKRRLLDVLSIERRERAQIMIGFQADDLNEYFTGRAMGLEAERPTTGMPEPIEASLRALIDGGGSHWPDIVRCAYAQDPCWWEPLEEMIRRVRATGDAEHLESDEPPFRVHVAPSSELNHPNGVPTLSLVVGTDCVG